MQKAHGKIARALHWGFIPVFAYALTKQLDSVAQLEDMALLRFEVVFAVAFLGLLVIRFLYMRRQRTDAMPENAPVWLRRLAKAGHLVIYASLAMIAVSGLAIAGVFVYLGADSTAMDMAVGLHENAVLVAYISIAGHIAAAIVHRLMGDGVWSSMVPVWKEDNEPS